MQLKNDKQEQLLQLVADKKNVFVTGPAGTGKSTFVKTIVQRLEDRGFRVAITAYRRYDIAQLRGVWVSDWNAGSVSRVDSRKTRFVKKMAIRRFNHPRFTELCVNMNIKAPMDFIETKQIAHGIELVLRHKKNVFFTGPAGTGKSTITSYIIRQLEERGVSLGITASTGIAAANIGGITLHRFAGCQHALESPHTLAERIQKRDEVLHRWQDTKVLIIDEISMIGKRLFDKVEEVARLVRGNSNPFGGIQVVLVGDFLQLPPVKDVFCYNSPAWKEVLDEVVHLEVIFRQNDPKFAETLKRLRIGEPTSADCLYIQTLRRKIRCPSGITPLHTVCTNAQADEINMHFLNKLPENTERVYEAEDIIIDGHGIDKDFLNRECSPMVARLVLRKGAKVMSTLNRVDGIYNGSMGIVVGYDDHGDPIVDFAGHGEVAIHRRQWSLYMQVKTYQERTTVDDEDCKDDKDSEEIFVKAKRYQLPLRLGWAITIHRAQGQSLDYQVACLQGRFTHGQAYTALSRARDPNKLQVLGYDTARQNDVCSATLKYYNL